MRILLTPLNWGIGHATRCIPIIHSLLAHNCEVFLASDGRSLMLLQQEFPSLPTLSLPSYGVQYRSDKLAFDLALQAPQVIQTIRREKRAIAALQQAYAFDAIITDNRFGCQHPDTYNVFITHQVHVQVPARIFYKPLNFVNQFFIRQFDECWIPDNEQLPFLSGLLSHPAPPLPTFYLGPLSRMRKREVPQKYKGAIILSGPEPQRSRLEEKLLAQAQSLEGNWILVQGKPEDGVYQRKAGNLTVYSFLATDALNQLIAESEWIICRSGYSTLMDLAKMGKKALLIPTPGQTEQEYLGALLQKQGICYTVSQKEVSLATDLQKATDYTGFDPAIWETDLVEQTISEWLLRAGRK